MHRPSNLCHPLSPYAAHGSGVGVEVVMMVDVVDNVVVLEKVVLVDVLVNVIDDEVVVNVDELVVVVDDMDVCEVWVLVDETVVLVVVGGTASQNTLRRVLQSASLMTIGASLSLRITVLTHSGAIAFGSPASHR